MNKTESIIKLPISNSPIFIVGSYRSGTSILTWCLGQHPNILPLPETNWIAKLTVDMQSLFKVGTVNGRYSHLGALDWNQNDFYAAFGRAVDQFVLDTREPRLRFIYKQVAKKHGLSELQIEGFIKKNQANPNSTNSYQIVRKSTDTKRRWVDGTPENTYNIYGLSMLFPNAKFIHILRNPNDVARSLMNFSKAGNAGFDYTELRAYATWKNLTEFAIMGEKALGKEKVLRITYEDLVSNPHATLKQCTDFLGEDFTTDCLQPLQEKINSSKIDKAQSPVPKPGSSKGLNANKYYHEILSAPFNVEPDIQVRDRLEKYFISKPNRGFISYGNLAFIVLSKLKKLFQNSRMTYL